MTTSLGSLKFAGSEGATSLIFPTPLEGGGKAANPGSAVLGSANQRTCLACIRPTHLLLCFPCWRMAFGYEYELRERWAR